MVVVDDILAFRDAFPRVVLTMGSFDGVHRGHQCILGQLARTAKRINGTAAVLTMRPHPREFFAPDHAPNLLTTDLKKVELLDSAGVEAVFFLPFDGTVADMAAEAFIATIIHDKCRAQHLVVGHDCRFGRNGEGNYEVLQANAERFGYSVTQVPPFVVNGERVSSTLIRERLLEGDLGEVEAFLGRKYSVVGEVLSGRGIGTQLGFPTLNIRPRHTAIPPHGVYAAEVRVAGESHPAAVNIGIAPTIEHDDITIEAHLLDFHGELGGQRIEVVFHERLRPERKFRDREELTAAIADDVERIRCFFTDRC